MALGFLPALVLCESIYMISLTLSNVWYMSGGLLQHGNSLYHSDVLRLSLTPSSSFSVGR